MLNTRVGNSLIGSLSESLIFVSERAKVRFARFFDRIAQVALNKRAMSANCSRSLFCYERTQQCAHIALLLRATRAMFKWIAHGCFLYWALLSERGKSKWAKERIPNPVLWILVHILKREKKGQPQFAFIMCSDYIKKILYNKYS